jgi:hypothetical protein
MVAHGRLNGRASAPLGIGAAALVQVQHLSVSPALTNTILDHLHGRRHSFAMLAARRSRPVVLAFPSFPSAYRPLRCTAVHAG